MESRIATPASPACPTAPASAPCDELQACRILIIDDEEANVRLLERVLARAGFENFIGTTDSREAATLFADFQPDLVLTDWLMPGLDGSAVIGQLRALLATDDYLPIVVLTADTTAQTRRRALTVGASDFLTKPFEQVEVLLRIRILLKARLSHLTIQRQNATLEESVRRRTIELERALAELKNSQQQVIQQERLAALGAMAGGLAHDFNNALSVIMAFGEILLSDAELGLTKEAALVPISTILTAAGDAARIVSRLGEFYRPPAAGELRLAIDLNQLIEQALAFAGPKIRAAEASTGRFISVHTECGEIPAIPGDASELREVLTNLIFNAVDAMPRGGTLILRTQTEGGAVVLRLIDTGTGMTEAVRLRCLEPFFTTKGASGTGLGLSMVFGIIQRHAGTIEIESEVGCGTTFILRLPVAGGEAVEFPEPMPSPCMPLRVLVVDDQPVLCALIARHLLDDLHTVDTVFSGGEALEKFQAAPFDLVVTDHAMDGMTGEQLAHRLKEIDPKVRVILLTGHHDDAREGNQFSPAIDLVLGKPMTQAGLRRAVAKVMALA